MTKYRKLFTTVRRNCSRFLGLLLSLCLLFEAGISAQANGDSQVENTCGGVAAVFNPGSGNSVDVVNATARELNLYLTAEEE